MAALTKDTIVRTRGVGRRRNGAVAAATTIYLGALIAVDAAGNIVNASDAAAIKVVGVALEQVVNAGAAGAKRIDYYTGLDVELINAGGAIVQAGDKNLCYVADNSSVTTAAVAVNDCIAGYVAEFTAAKVWVYVDELIGRVA
jgi:hypothetical protein